MPTRTMAKVMEVERVYLTVAETQRYLGFAGVDTQREWRDSGQIPYYMVGRIICYRKADIDKFMERHRITPVGASKIERN